MADWRDFPLPDGSYSDETRPWSQQDVCNYLPTFAEAQGTRSRCKYVPVPGLTTLAGVGNGPHRGIRDVEGKLFCVSGNKLYQVTTAGVATELGTIPGVRRVSMVHNQIDGGNELIIATGDNSYVWNTVTETLTATGVPLLFVDFINQLIVGVDVGRRFWRYSGLADATAWNTLDNESAESSPDRLVGVIVSQGEVLLFGERTTEVWSNSPTDNTAFQRSTVIEKGCANGNTICRLDNTVYFVGNDSIPYRLQGYTPTPIASKAITAQVASGEPDKLFANTWEDRGYVVYYLTAQDGQTWGYDVTCQKWHRRESFGLDRWRVNTLVKSNGVWYAGDYSNGKLYQLTWGYVYEGCEIMPRTIRTGVMHNNGNRMFISALKLLVNTGAAASTTADVAPTVTGAMPDGTMGDSYSYQYTITPTYPGQVYTVSATGLPDGLSISATGLVTGTPVVAGTFAPTITVTTDCAEATLADEMMIAAADGFACVTDGFWLKADATADTMTKDTDSDHYYQWVESCNNYIFCTVALNNDETGTKFSDGPNTGSINGIRAAHFNSADANSDGIEQYNAEPNQSTIKNVASGRVCLFAAAIWRNDSNGTTPTDRRVVYWAPESPANGNNQRFGLHADGGGTLNGVSAIALQDYLDSPGTASDATDREGDVVIAVATANWLTGALELYVNGTLSAASSIPNYAGLSDAAKPLKFFIGSQDQGQLDADIHLGELIAQGLSAPLSNFARKQIEGYLAWKWRGDLSDGDPVAALPADHPYKTAPPTL